MAIKFIGYGLSVLILSSILFGFLQRLWEGISSLLRFCREKSDKEKGRLKRLVLIRAGFLLPWETITILLTLFFAIFVFHWFTSSIIIIALTSFLFKEIISEIPYLLLTAFYFLLRKIPHLEEDSFVKETGIIPSHFPSCLYIPQKAKSLSEVYAAIGQGLRALRNNARTGSNLIFIYHSDTEDNSLIAEEIRLILEAREEFGNRVFLFARNREAYNPFFLKKPGGYMSDYQILTTGVWHPLTYISSAFDGRRQKILSPNGEIKNHYPFYPVISHPDKSEGSPPITGASNGVYLDGSPVSACQTFILHRGNLFVKERMALKRSGEKEESFPDIKIIAKEYLINKENPAECYLVSQGAVFSSAGNLLFKPNRWKINPSGEIELAENKNQILKGKRFAFIFVHLVELSGGRKLFIDKIANLIDPESGKIWARREDYRVERECDLYKLQNKKFSLVKGKFPTKKKIFYGEDYRRMVFDRLDYINAESLQDLIKEKIVSPQEAKTFMQTGIAGDVYKLHIAKKGNEEEFFVEEPLIGLKERVTGGYLVRQGAGFSLNEGNLLYKDVVIEPKDNLRNIFIHEENNRRFLMFEDNKEKFFLRYIDTNEKVRAAEGETYFYIQNPWLDKTKPAKGGLVANRKDGFYLDKAGCLWYAGDAFKEITPPIQVAPADRVRKLLKEKIFIDYTDGASLKRNSLIAEAGGWYKDRADNFRRRKLIASLDGAYFNEDLDAIVIEPLTKERKIYPLNSYCVGETSLWQRFSEDDEIIPDENLIVKDGDLVREEIIAQDREYAFTPAGEAVIKNKGILPYGIYLKFPNGEVLKDESEDFVFADCGIRIVNQTDADAEFQPQTIPYLNSQLIRNLQEKDPFLMYQPEIGFGNQGQSAFARFHAWAQQMYRFTGRAVFSIFGESSAYGKMTKVADSYVKNILFKEAIPPLARTHDHWEAMHLKTALVLSHPHLKAKNLIENTPPNFFIFLKRQEGWLAGDLVLLEYETYFGVLLDFLRAGFSLLKFDLSAFCFWLGYIRKRIIYLRERADTPSYLAKLFRIWLIKRLAFCPFYYGLWLILVGTLSLIIPGTLTIKAPALAWLLFWIILAILIGLPKIIMPLLERLVLSEDRKGKFILVSSAILAAIFINRAGKTLFPAHWGWINAGVLIACLSCKLFARIFIFLFSGHPGLLRRAGHLLIFGLFVLSGWFYIPPLLAWLENIPSANWIFLFLLDFLPRISGFILSLVIILGIFPSGRIALGLIKKGVAETLYSSSILLLNVIYIPLTVLRKIIFMVLHPQRSAAWITSPFVEKLLAHKITLQDSYVRLIAAPFFSSVFIILPVVIGLADPSLIFYGWPVFIWSWMLGPVFVWSSGNFGEAKNFSSLEFLGIRDKLVFRKKELMCQGYLPCRDDIINNIMEFNLRLKNELAPRESLRLFLYFLTDLGWGEPAVKEAVAYHLKKELLPDNLREYDWQTLNEISRARVVLRLYRHGTHRAYLQKEKVEINLVGAVFSLINLMGPLKFGVRGWEALSVSRQIRIIQDVFARYKLNDNLRFELRKLLQVFSRTELAALYKKLKGCPEINSLFESIPPEFIYLRKAVRELAEVPAFDSLSYYQRKLFLDLIISRYALKQKAYTKILRLAAKLKR